MIIGLDSATPPTVLQAAAARASGIGLWNGYLSEIPQRDGLYRPWTPAEFDVVKTINPHPIAFTSGWDDPVATAADAARQGLRLCLDVERLIRDDGPWVQGWLDASGAGLYGVRMVHLNRRASFHIAAFYPTPMGDPRANWPTSWPSPGTPCGWQWQNSHPEFGVTVDRSWLDDWFAAPAAEETEHMDLFRSNEKDTDGNPKVYVIVIEKGQKRHLGGAEYNLWAKAGAKITDVDASELAPLADAGGTAQGTVTGTLTVT
jgi:hypothetical protein